MLNNQNIQHNWPQIKTQVLNKWNKLSESDVEKTHGNAKTLYKLVQSKYGSIKHFNKIYEIMCESVTPSSKNLSSELPESPEFITERSFNEMETTSFEKFEGVANINREINRETDDELSAYTPVPHMEVYEIEHDEHQEHNNTEKAYQKFTTPDEFSLSQNQGAGLDIPLGRSDSSATTISTAKAAPNSSAVSSTDATRKM